LAQAYREAKSMVEKRPQSGFAHFTLSYVLRYAALSKEAAQECDLALRLDPGNYQFRSCASVFFTTGQYDHGREFLKLDAGSEWSNNVEVMILLREGKTKDALQQLRHLPESSFFHTRALEACYGDPRAPGAAQLLQQAEKEIFAYRDPEPKFSQAGSFNPCLGNAFTARLMRSAIEGGFCGYDQLQLDPMLRGFRQSVEYPALLAQAKQCQDRFIAERDQPQR
jgi:hypothetical protein